MKKKNYEQVYNDFWKGIVEDENGNVNMDQVKRELYDFHVLIGNIPIIFDHVTGGGCSKPMTKPEVVIALHDDYMKQQIDFYIEDALENRE